MYIVLLAPTVQYCDSADQQQRILAAGAYRPYEIVVSRSVNSMVPSNQTGAPDQELDILQFPVQLEIWPHAHRVTVQGPETNILLVPHGDMRFEQREC